MREEVTGLVICEHASDTSPNHVMPSLVYRQSTTAAPELLHPSSKLEEFRKPNSIF